MPLSAIFRYLQIPLRAAPLLTIVVFVVLLAIARQAGIVGIPLALIVVSWFFKYSFVLLDSVVEGRKEPPALSAEMVNPVEQRPFGMLLLMIGFFVATMSLEAVIGANGVTALRIVGLAIVPAMVAAMSITGRFVAALNPVAVFGIVARMPVSYFGMLVTIAVLWFVPVSLLGLTGAAGFLPNTFLLAIGMYLWLAMLACIGGMAYEHREELDYTPAESPERSEARNQAELDKERDKQMDPIFAECRGGSFANAGASVRAIVERSSQPLAEFRWLYARASQWPDPRLANYLVQLCLPRLLEARANGEALDLVRARLKVDPNFRPLAGAHLLRVATLARDAGDKGTARTLLADFDACYPNDPAALIAAKLAGELRR